MTRRDVLRFGAVAGLGLTAGSSLLSACGAAASDTLDNARAAGTLTMGFSNEAPYQFVDRANKVTGILVELARRAAADMGIKKLEPIVGPFTSLIPGLQAKRFDIASGLIINTERCQELLFADPVLGTREVFIMKKTARYQVGSFEEVASHPDMRLAVDAAGIERTYATKLGVTESQLVLLPDSSTWPEVLKSGRADAMVLSPVSASIVLAKPENGALMMTEPFKPVIDGREQGGYVSYAFRHQDTPLRDEFSKAMRGLLDSGAAEKIAAPFGSLTEEIKDAARQTAAALCSAPS